MIKTLGEKKYLFHEAFLLGPKLVQTVIYLDFMLPVTMGIGNLIRAVARKKIKNDLLLVLYDLILDRIAQSMVKAAVRKTKGL